MGLAITLHLMIIKAVHATESIEVTACECPFASLPAST
jgi:hypothetical protein